MSLRNLDERALRWARSHAHTPARERAVERFSRLGEHGAIWLCIGLCGYVLDRRQRTAWGRASVTVAGAFALNTALKLLVGRRRPELPDLPALTTTPTRLSFPSAHACTSFAGARSFSRLGLPPVGVYGAAVGLSASRVYLGVHYPSDVLAGALLGEAVARLRAPRQPG